MAAQKGYPSKERDLRLGESDVYVTAEPIRQKQHGLSVLAHTFVQSIGSDAVEANSTTRIINATAHAAKVGDIINFTSGALDGQEVKVQAVTANTITLSETLASAPVVAVTFEILRHKYPVVDASGSLSVSSSSGPIQYTEDGVPTPVSEDTAVPANSKPLPVKLVGMSGDLNVTAGDLNVDIDHTTSSVKIGDGTDFLAINADGSINTSITATNLDIRDLVFATDKVDVSGSSVSISGTVPVSDGGGSLTIDAVNLDIRDLSSATDSITVVATDLDIRNLSSASDSIAVTDGGGSLTVDGSVTVSATDLDIRNLVFADDKVDVSGSSVTVSSTNLDIRDLTSVSDSVSAVQSGTWNINNVSGTVSLPTGASTEATLSTLNGKVPANLTVTATRLLVDGSGVTQPVSGTVTANVANPAVSTFVRNDYSSVNVTTAAYVQLVASTAATYKRLSIFDSSGQTLKIALGAAASEADLFLVFPGGNGDIDVNIPAGTRISIRAVSATASVGEISINFFV